jgi:GTPase SAR1 family protein
MATAEVNHNEFLLFRQHGLQALKSISALGCVELEPRIRAAEKRLRHDRVKLLVVGEFSRGKSTFINAFVGEPLLPSKVTPTTATINVIRGGETRTASVRYDDGTVDHYVLPDLQANRFLSDIVTASNGRSHQIVEAVLSVPGRLNEVLVDIVDTPGVNDLNKLREDVTFRYLSECDAAVILLDAQQPLSESEGRFLKQRVIGSDVTKLLFVINRIDERVAEADEGTEQQIADVVRQRLIKEVGLENPQVFALSALETLKARFRRERNEYLESFEEFETHFLSFASVQATIGRAETHRNRILQIATDGLVQIENELTATRMHGSEIQTALSTQEQKLRAVENGINRLPTIIDEALNSIKPDLLSHGESDLRDRREKLLSKLAMIKSANDMDQFQSDVQHSLQTWIDSLSRQTWKQSQATAETIRSKHPELFSSASTLIIAKRELTSMENLATERIEFDSTMNAPEAFGSSDMIFGGLAGLIASWVIGGPVTGILFGLLGAGIAGGVRKQAETDAAIEQKKIKLKDSLEMHFDSMGTKLAELVEKVIAREHKTILNALNERANVTFKTLQESILALKHAAQNDEDQRVHKTHALAEKKDALLDVMQRNPVFANTDA